MSCNHCGVKFNFFHKELGCANCGLSFCNRCLKQKCKIPNKGTNEQNVCKLCFSQITSGTSAHSNLSYSLPDTYLRRLENLENPSAPPITVYKHDQKIEKLRSGLSPQDQKIVDRLEKLKEAGKLPPPSETELRRRLANLKGENDYVEGPIRNVFIPDTRSDQERVDSLLEQFVSEQDVELAHNPQEEIEARLATLRGQGVRPNEGPYISNLHDSSGSEEEVDKLTKKIMDEVALDEKCPISKKLSSGNEGDEEEGMSRSSPELPFCVLCNDDPKLRCLDCGGDLYCSRCYVEVHDKWEKDHRNIPFKPK